RLRLRARRVQGPAGGAPAREPRVGGGELLQEDERGREPRVRCTLLRNDAVGDARADPGHPRARGVPAEPPRRGDGAPVARDAAEGRARAGAAHLAGAPAARRADDRARPALEGGGAGVHPRDPAAARLDDPALHARHEGGRGARRSYRAARPRRAVVPRAGRRREGAVRRRDDRGGVLRRHRPGVRGREDGRGRGEGGVRMTSAEITFSRRRVLRDELVGLYGVVERNVYLTKRYLLWDLAFLLWTIANTLTIVFISRGVGVSPAEENALATKLLVGGVIWAFLGIIFEIVTETVAWERWEGTIEYTFMAPVSRPVHLIGMGVYAVLYGLVRAAAVFVAVVAFIGLHVSHANYGAAIALLAIASVSFIGVGMMTAVLPLVSPEKGTQLGFVAQGLMLVVS